MANPPMLEATMDGYNFTERMRKILAFVRQRAR
jgi:hypothetical protein